MDGGYAACLFFPVHGPGTLFLVRAGWFFRLVLGVHFPTDTLIGAALGVGAAIFSLNYILI